MRPHVLLHNNGVRIVQSPSVASTQQQHDELIFDFLIVVSPFLNFIPPQWVWGFFLLLRRILCYCIVPYNTQIKLLATTTFE